MTTGGAATKHVIKCGSGLMARGWSVAISAKVATGTIHPTVEVGKGVGRMIVIVARIVMVATTTTSTTTTGVRGGVGVLVGCVHHAHNGLHLLKQGGFASLNSSFSSSFLLLERIDGLRRRRSRSNLRRSDGL